MIDKNEFSQEQDRALGVYMAFETLSDMGKTYCQVLAPCKQEAARNRAEVIVESFNSGLTLFLAGMNNGCRVRIDSGRGIMDDRLLDMVELFKEVQGEASKELNRMAQRENN